MLDGIEALAALEKFGTMSEAATRLRITQSAVSKRLQALEQTVGLRLVEPQGRRVRLTPRGEAFLNRARPLVAELRALSRGVDGSSPPVSNLSVALGDSIASSWGPRVVGEALSALPGFSIDLHAHRSVLVVESVRLGRYDVGLCTAPQTAPDLVLHALLTEPMVLVHAGLGSRASVRRAVISIEPTSATWRAVEPLLRAHHPELLGGRLIAVESFGAVLQMVKAGFGDGIVPVGLVMEMGVPKRGYRELRGVERNVVLLARKTVAQLGSFRALHEQLTKVAGFGAKREARAQ